MRKDDGGTTAPTPAQAQKALSDEPGANLPRHRHVGLPGLGEDPAEGRQEEKVQKGRGHDADALRKKREVGRRKKITRYSSSSLKETKQTQFWFWLRLVTQVKDSYKASRKQGIDHIEISSFFFLV